MTKAALYVAESKTTKTVIRETSYSLDILYIGSSEKVIKEMLAANKEAEIYYLPYPKREKGVSLEGLATTFRTDGAALVRKDLLKKFKDRLNYKGETIEFPYGPFIAVVKR